MKLSVLIGGDDRELQAAIKRAQSSLRKLGGEMREGINTTVKYGAAMAAAGIAISAHFVKKSMEAIDAQADLAQQLRTTVASIATLERAGAVAGVSIEKMSAASTMLNGNLSDAARGIGPAVSALSSLNLTAEELLRIPLDQRIALINQRIRENIPLNEQASVAMDLFGKKAGQAMMQLSPETIRAAAEEARVFGTALSALDAKKVEMANDSFSRVGMAVDGFWKQLTVQLAPVLKVIGDKILELTKEAGGMGAIATKAFDGIVTAAGFVVDAIDGVKRVFSILADSIIAGMSMAALAVAKMWAGVLRTLDHVPGVDFSESIASVDQFARESESIVGSAVENIQETLARPIPSEGFKKFIDDAKIAADQAAALALKNQGAGGENTGEGDEGIDDKRLDALRKRFMTEQQLKLEHDKVMHDLEIAFIEGQIESDTEYYAMREAAEAEHLDRLVQIRGRGLGELERFTRMSFRAQAQTITGQLTDMTASVAQHSRSMFEINKVAGIANVLLKAQESISNAYAFGSKFAGPAGGAAMAAVAAGATLAQIQAIRSTQFNGGGGGTAPSVGGTPAPPVTPIGGSGGSGGGSGPTSIVHLHGESFGVDQVRALVERINQDNRDGGRIILR